LLLAVVVCAHTSGTAWGAGSGLRIHGEVGPASAPVKTAVEAVLSGPDVGRIQVGSGVFIAPTSVAAQIRSPTDSRLVLVGRVGRTGASAPGEVKVVFPVPSVAGGSYDVLVDCERCADLTGGDPMVAAGAFTVLVPKVPIWPVALVALALGALLFVQGSRLRGVRPVWAHQGPRGPAHPTGEPLPRAPHGGHGAPHAVPFPRSRPHIGRRHPHRRRHEED